MSGNCTPRVVEKSPVIDSMPAGWVAEQVIYSRRGQSYSRIEIRDLKTGERYRYEPLWATACKCLELVVAIPLYTLAYIAWNAVQIPMAVLYSIACGVKGALTAKSCSEVGQKIFNAAVDVALDLTTGLWTVVRAPFYTLQMFFGAWVGIASPLEGRQIVARAEAELHQKPKWSDVRRVDQIETIWLLRRDCPYTIYLAYCMQTLNTPVISRSQALPSQNQSFPVA